MTEQELEKYLRDTFPGYDKIIQDPGCAKRLNIFCYKLGEMRGLTQRDKSYNQMFKGYNAVSIKQ